MDSVKTFTPDSGLGKIPGELGVWFFVAGDLIVFAVFFVLIASGQRDNGELFALSRQFLDLWVGVANTLLLLTGSLFVAAGVDACRWEHSPRARHYFSLAMLCGVVFVLNKSLEWGAKLQMGITPATNDFFMFFFIFTGIHLLHVLVGLGVLALLRYTSCKPTLSERNLCTLESGAIFWHLVDLLWVVLFAMLYLM